ncbi:MAG: hypothetical protein IT260_22585 [Saprospiraceae bacterium]|nr:hypothetical protein [Saprospiraceae bacterium]
MYRLCCLALLATCFSCAPAAPPLDVRPAFYCWEAEPSYQNDAVPDSLQASRLYLRLFDVAWDPVRQKPYPAGPFQSSWRWGKTAEPVPVVFITNETLQHLDSAGCADLAQRMSRKIEARLLRLASMERDVYYWELLEDPEQDTLYNATQRLIDTAARRSDAWMSRIRELQIDCDWTAGTRDRFFYLLTELQRLHPQYALSCTIRLHQFRQPDQTGVPPVARGMLMCYNVGDLKDPASTNSIFNYSEASKYLQNKKPYPLPLDLALPAFRWGVLFHLGQFQCLVPEEVWDEQKDQFQALGKNMYRAKTDFTLNGHYVREGDLLRLEEPSQEELLAVIGLLRRQITAQPLHLAFFHVGSTLCSYENIPRLQALVRAFR